MRWKSEYQIAKKRSGKHWALHPPLLLEVALGQIQGHRVTLPHHDAKDDNIFLPTTVTANAAHASKDFVLGRSSLSEGVFACQQLTFDVSETMELRVGQHFAAYFFQTETTPNTLLRINLGQIGTPILCC